MIENYVNRIIEGDCLEVMKNIPNKSIDMILCDLPYGTTQNKWDSIIDLDELWKEYKRVIKDNGVIILTSHGVFTAKLILSNEKWFKYKLVWEKSKATNFLKLCLSIILFPILYRATAVETIGISLSMPSSVIASRPISAYS